MKRTDDRVDATVIGVRLQPTIHPASCEADTADAIHANPSLHRDPFAAAALMNAGLLNFYEEQACGQPFTTLASGSNIKCANAYPQAHGLEGSKWQDLMLR